MDSEDTLYGRIKNGVLTLPGNNASIRVVAAASCTRSRWLAGGGSH